MSVKKYFKREFTKEMFFLEHESTPDFYLSCWQRNRSTLPLLFLRTIIFVGCVCILLASMILTTQLFNIGLWFIFLTHWGLVLNTAASGLAFAVSVKAYFRPTDGSLELPWYVKTYWVMYNIAIPIAFFISLFYWTLLTAGEDDYAIDPILDVFIHGVNSVLMLMLVVIARHPTRLLHFYWPVCTGLVYLFFTIVFYLSGAQSPFGTPWIYPMLNWENPGTTMIVVGGSAVAIIIMHIVLVLITLCRDKLTRRYRDTNSLSISYDERYN